MLHSILPAQGEVVYADFLKTLITQEIESRLLYEEIAELVQEVSVRNHLEFLVREKRCHEGSLKDLLGKISGENRTLTGEPVKASSGKAREMAGLDVPGLLEEVIRIEENNHQFILEFNRNSTLPEEKELMIYLAEESKVFLDAIKRFRDRVRPAVQG
jgi:Mn-containing catalase